MAEPLFNKHELSSVVRSYEHAGIRKEVESWDRNKVLSASEQDLVDHLVDKFSLNPPILRANEAFIEDEGEKKVGVEHFGFRGDGQSHYRDGTFVTVAVPFDGDADLFYFQSSQYTLRR